MRTRSVVILIVAFLASPARPGSAQAPAPAAAPVEAGAGPQTRPAAPAPPAPYTYEPEGRRDPFVNLLGGIADPERPASVRPSGVPGLLIGELTVRGVIRDRNGYIALVQGPDNKTHMVRTGDKLLDGSVKSIAPDRVVFSQDVNDPLSLVKQREVSKAVRQGEGRGGAPGF
jgi:type IV pilus assembly protein PilP